MPFGPEMQVCVLCSALWRLKSISPHRAVVREETGGAESEWSSFVSGFRWCYVGGTFSVVVVANAPSSSS